MSPRIPPPDKSGLMDTFTVRNFIVMSMGSDSVSVTLEPFQVILT